MNFKDYFSAQAKKYAAHRPHYPQELYGYLFSLLSDKEIAWDCATGNGQVAGELSRIFKSVIATDASESQLENAIPATNITYKVEPAEHTSIPGNSIDLITVGQALHWFNLEEFYREANRVLKPQGIIAAWTYEHFKIPGVPEKILLKYHDEILKGYWPVERRLVGKEYLNLPFPFQKFTPPRLVMKHHWDFQQLIGYLESWSGTQRFAEAKGYNPVEDIKDDFLHYWGNPAEKKEISWDIYLLAGKK